MEEFSSSNEDDPIPDKADEGGEDIFPNASSGSMSSCFKYLPFCILYRIKGISYVEIVDPCLSSLGAISPCLARSHGSPAQVSEQPRPTANSSAGPALGASNDTGTGARLLALSRRQVITEHRHCLTRSQT